MNPELENLFEYVKDCINSPALVREYNRVYGTSLGMDNRTALQAQFDRAAGIRDHDVRYKDSELNEFVGFVYYELFLPLAQQRAS